MLAGGWIGGASRGAVEEEIGLLILKKEERKKGMGERAVADGKKGKRVRLSQRRPAAARGTAGQSG